MEKWILGSFEGANIRHTLHVGDVFFKNVFLGRYFTFHNRKTIRSSFR
jgi:hypothetical protein